MSIVRILAAVAALSVALASAAAAQSPGASGPAPGLREVTDPQRAVPPWNVPVGRVRGMDVHGPKGNRLGAAEAVLEDAAGQPAAVVVRYRSPIGGSDAAVAVPFGQVDLKGDHLVTRLAAEQLGAMPIWSK